MRFVFIINPGSGQRKDVNYLAEMIRDKIGKEQSLYYEICFTERSCHAREIAEKAVNNGTDVVVAVGGDGTMNEVASALVNTESALAVIPRGSGNGFARSLDIPLDKRKALDFIARAKFKRIDAASIGDKYFFGIAGIGFDACIAAKFQEFWIRGQVPYIYIGIREFLKYQYQRFTLITDENEFQSQPLLIAFANTSQYGNGARIAPDADYNDGLLDICILSKMSILQGIKSVPPLFNGTINNSKLYRRFRTASLKVRTEDTSILYHIDGEPFEGDRELDIRVLPGALKVCCNS